MSAARALVKSSADVIELADGIVEGTDWPLVPDAVYRAHFVRHVVIEQQEFKRQPKVFLLLKIIEPGPYFGCMLFRAYRVEKRLSDSRFTLRPRADLRKMICRVLDMRVRLTRVSLRALRHRVLQIRTRTVVRDGKQRELPLARRYWVVDDILESETA